MRGAPQRPSRYPAKVASLKTKLTLRNIYCRLFSKALEFIRFMHSNRSPWEVNKLATIHSFLEFCQGREQPLFPIEIFLELSNVCNLKCAMCAEFSLINPLRLAALQGTKRSMMSTSDLNENVVSLLQNALLVHCSGFGESTIHPQFREIIAMAASYGVMVHFITNAQELDSDLAEFLVENCVYKIMVSASGATKEEYEQVYLGGKFDTLVNGLRRLRDAKKAKGSRYPLVEINSLGFRHHVAKFDEFVALMSDCGADIIHLKKLQPYEHIPELFEHVSIMRPWVEGPILLRAQAIGRERGTIVDFKEYLHNQADSEDAYETAVGALMSAAESKLSVAPFGANSISTFSTQFRAAKPVRAPSKVSRAVIDPKGDQAQAAEALHIDDLQTGLTADERFYCMEPFKTTYVANDGGLRPCCFSGRLHPYLGSVRSSDGIESWRGSGFSVVRSSILNGLYPTSMCQRCLKDRIGPDHHSFGHILLDYMEWYATKFGEDLSGPISGIAPDALSIAFNSSPSTIVKRHKGETPAHPTRENQADDLLTFLATLSEGSGESILEGWFERLEGNWAVGWVWSPAFAGLRLPLSIWHDGVFIAGGVAMLPREDLANAGKGDGFYGFRIPLPPRAEAWSKKELQVTVGDGQISRTLPA